MVFQTGSQQRSEFGGHFRKAVEYVWNGRIGKLKTIRIGVGEPAVPCDLPTQDIPKGTDWDTGLGPAPERGYHEELCPKGVHKHFPAWRKYREYAGGQIADMGAHHFDIAQWALKMDGSGPTQIDSPWPESGPPRRLSKADSSPSTRPATRSTPARSSWVASVSTVASLPYARPAKLRLPKVGSPPPTRKRLPR